MVGRRTVFLLGRTIREKSRLKFKEVEHLSKALYSRAEHGGYWRHSIFSNAPFLEKLPIPRLESAGILCKYTVTNTSQHTCTNRKGIMTLRESISKVSYLRAERGN